MIQLFPLDFSLVTRLRELVGLPPTRPKFPGPSGYPLVGSLLELQAGHAKTLARWTHQYGDIFEVDLGGRVAIFLNTYEAIAKTIISKGAAFQSRPEFALYSHTFSKALDSDALTTLGSMKYSPNISHYRRLLSQQTTTQKLKNFDPCFMRGWRRFIRLLADTASADTPRDLGRHLWTTTVAIGIDQLVGQIPDEDTAALIADSNIRIFRQRSLGSPIYDYVPLLAYIELMTSAMLSPTLSVLHALRISPTWLESLNTSKAHAERLRRIEVDYCEGLLGSLLKRLESGEATPCILGDLFRQHGHHLSPKEQFMFTSTLTGAGMAAGTTLVWLTGKLAASPDMQETAFTAIKTVYGDTLPNPLETDRVEYIKALGLEASRFWTIIRSGFPRETIQDVVVDGVPIPKGTLVIYNSFQINRDPLRYDRPHEFVPERWMHGRDGRTDHVGQTGPKIGVPHLTHGAGRRMCMGIPSPCRTHFILLFVAPPQSRSLRCL